jgi:hypothetical protein
MAAVGLASSGVWLVEEHQMSTTPEVAIGWSAPQTRRRRSRRAEKGSPAALLNVDYLNEVWNEFARDEFFGVEIGFPRRMVVSS